MKLVLEEHIKNRVVGAAAILSLVAIFLPAILKRANQPFDSMSRVALRMPAQPEAPKFKIAQESQMFRAVKVAKVDVRPLPVQMPKLSAPKTIALAKPSVVPKISSSATDTDTASSATLAKKSENSNSVDSHLLPSGSKTRAVEPLKLNVAMNNASLSRSQILISAKDVSPSMLGANQSKIAINNAKNKINPNIVKSTALNNNKKSVGATHSNSNAGFSVQVASLSNQNNAVRLVQRLKARGYQAHYVVISYPRGVKSYRVLVGNARDRQEVMQLQRNLASQMQLKGFVVQGEVG